jgi:superoxide dismutase, Cu-Zn family
MNIAGKYIAVAIAMCAVPAVAADITIKIRAIDNNGVGKEIGTIRAVDSKGGLRLVPRLSGIGPGAHGFHIHQNPGCGNKGAGGKTGAGLAAGGHYDPGHKGSHLGPMGHGHHGDLPALMADADGIATKSIVAPKLKVADLWGRSIMIHASGDNYSDHPKPLGGGGARIACGTIVKAKKRTNKMKKM